MGDTRLRQLERQYHQNPCKETEDQWHVALKRAGICRAPDSIYTKQVNEARVEVGTRVYFRVFGSTPNNAVVPLDTECPICKNKTPFGVQLHYGTEGIPDRVATLTNPNAGRIAGNHIVDLDPDGQTIYSVDWDIASDGIASTNTCSVLLSVDYF